MTTVKTRETRARRVAERQGFTVQKKTAKYGNVDAGWLLIGSDNTIALQRASLEELERFLDIDTSKDTPEPSPESGS